MEINDIINDRYTITKEIGHGGYATVFLAYDSFYSKFVAIKVLKYNANKNDKVITMFKQEAMTIAAISNKNVVKIYETGVYKNNPYIVMDYVKGKSLKSIIYGGGYLLVDEVYSYMNQIINGLEACHNVGIIHRDIKPNNIIKKIDGTLVLIDFGTAFISDEKINLYQEDGSSIIGTIYYIAPELISNPAGSIQTDIYALGITMFEMFTGKYPFYHPDTNDKIKIIQMHINEAFPSIRRINPEVPVEFENIIYKCCEKDPKKRYKNVNELRIDLYNAYEIYKNPKQNKQSFFQKLFKKGK